MRLLLDTNRYTDLARGDPDAIGVVGSADEALLPLIALAELRAGFLGGTRGRENEAHLRTFLRQPGVGILLPDEPTTLHYAAVYQQLRQQGTPIPSNDIWIAALALQHGLTLYARDGHFDHLPQLSRI